MKCIVPLAGPDLWTPQFGLRPLFVYDHRFLLDWALETRSWRGLLAASDYIFVIRVCPQMAELIGHLEAQWPGCRIVMLPDLTDGAMLSVMAGVTLVHDGEPIIVDLADIIFDDPVDLTPLPAGVGMIVPVFQSRSEAFSYLEIENGVVTRAREKVVISSHASAGVYIFASREVFLRSAVHSMLHADELQHRNNYFICPMANGIIADGLSVLALPVANVIPVGKLFH